MGRSVIVKNNSDEVINENTDFSELNGGLLRFNMKSFGVGFSANYELVKKL